MRHFAVHSEGVNSGLVLCLGILLTNPLCSPTCNKGTHVKRLSLLVVGPAVLP